MKYAIGICVAFAVAPLAHAGAIIDLAPTQPGPYLPGQQLEIEFLLTQEPGGEDIFLRFLQFDFADTDPALTLEEEFRFDYSAQNGCAQYPELCGVGHAEFPRLTVDWGIGVVVSTVFVGFSHDANAQVRLPAVGTIGVGSIGVTLPTQPGEYLIDVMNADQANANGGARFDFGFGPASGPDPYTIWRAYDDEAIAGGMFTASTTAGAGFQFEYNPIPGVITPEPTSLTLLALGGIAALGRRRAIRACRSG